MRRVRGCVAAGERRGDGGFTDPYNGKGVGRIHRVAKTGAGEALIARSLQRPIAITVDDTYVYFATRDDATQVSTLWRLQKDAPACEPTCAMPTQLTTYTGGRLDRLVHTGTVLLVQDAEEGRLFRFNGASLAPITTTSDIPTLAVTPAYAFTGSAQIPTVRRAALIEGGVMSPFYVLPDAGPTVSPGAPQLATDCTTLNLLRSNQRLVRVDVMNGQVVGDGGAVNAVGVTRMVTDERYLWMSAYNAGGIYAYDVGTRQTQGVATGNFWTVWTDDDGVYWGNHERGERGVLYMLDKRK